MHSDRTPYTYLIGWSQRDKYYYGVRYAKGCHPGDLFNTYFTSSKFVLRYVEQHGNPDIIQIRRCWKTPEKAIAAERRILESLDLAKNPRFLNVKNATGTSANYGGVNLGQWQHRPRIKQDYMNKYSDEERKKIFGRKRNDQSRQLQGLRSKERMANTEFRKQLSVSVTEAWKDPIKKAKHRDAQLGSNNTSYGTIWIHDPDTLKNKRIPKEHLDDYLPNYTLGRYIPEETKRKMINNRRKDSDFGI